MNTAHLAAFGAREIPRGAFLDLVRAHTRRSNPGVPWQLDRDLASHLLSRHAHAG
jgi:Leu/Phe-tRNA-protein transferase